MLNVKMPTDYPKRYYIINCKQKYIGRSIFVRLQISSSAHSPQTSPTYFLRARQNLRILLFYKIKFSSTLAYSMKKRITFVSWMCYIY
jgi:hypothetical protein